MKKLILDNITNPQLWGWLIIMVIIVKHIYYYFGG